MLLLALLFLLGQSKLCKTSAYQDVEPRESLLDVRYVYTLAIVLGQHLSEICLHRDGRLLVCSLSEEQRIKDFVK